MDSKHTIETETRPSVRIDVHVHDERTDAEAIAGRVVETSCQPCKAAPRKHSRQSDVERGEWNGEAEYDEVPKAPEKLPLGHTVGMAFTPTHQEITNVEIMPPKPLNRVPLERLLNNEPVSIIRGAELEHVSLVSESNDPGGDLKPAPMLILDKEHTPHEGFNLNVMDDGRAYLDGKYVGTVCMKDLIDIEKPEKLEPDDEIQQIVMRGGKITFSGSHEFQLSDDFDIMKFVSGDMLVHNMNAHTLPSVVINLDDGGIIRIDEGELVDFRTYSSLPAIKDIIIQHSEADPLPQGRTEFLLWMGGKFLCDVRRQEVVLIELSHGGYIETKLGRLVRMNIPEVDQLRILSIHVTH